MLTSVSQTVFSARTWPPVVGISSPTGVHLRSSAIFLIFLALTDREFLCLLVISSLFLLKNSTLFSSAFSLFSPRCRAAQVPRSNYRSIKGFVALPFFCQALLPAGAGLGELRRVRVNEISFHVEISREKAFPWKQGLRGKGFPSLSMGQVVPPPSPGHITPSV